jgi:hypothetical protein
MAEIQDMTISMAEGEMTIGSFVTKGFRLYSLTFISIVALVGLIAAKMIWQLDTDITALAVIAANLIGVFTGKKS